jgi:hypothetical protein
MSVGHHRHEPSEDHKRELAKIEREAWFIKARKIPIEINHATHVPLLGGSSKPTGGKRIIFVDHRAYHAIKRLGLLDGLIEHETVEGILLDRGEKYAAAHEMATAAENEKYPDPKAAERHYPSLLKIARSQPVENIHPRLRLEPYRAAPESRTLLRAMLKSMTEDRKAA